MLLDILVTIIVCISILIIKRLRNVDLNFKNYRKWTYFEEHFSELTQEIGWLINWLMYMFINNVKMQLPSKYPFENPGLLMNKFLSYVSKYGVFSGPYFPVFRLDTEIYVAWIQEIRTRKIPYHGMNAQLVRTSERNSVVVGSDPTQANFL